MIPDVNVLVAAFRADHSHHDSARTCLTEMRRHCVQGAQTLVLIPAVLTGFLRLVTHPRVFVQPDTIEDAVGFVDALLATPGVELIAGDGDWPLLRNLLLTKQLQANLVTDAWIASTVQALSEHLVTFDRDFRRLLSARDVTVLIRKAD